MSFDSSDRDSRFRVVMGDAEIEGPARRDRSFRVAILGDFSGRANRRVWESGGQQTPWRPLQVDRDNFDQVLARLKPELHLRLGQGGADQALRFGDLDSFHPDQLYEHVEIFARLRDLRRRLGSPETFEAAAAELGVGPLAATEQRPREPARQGPPDAGTLPSGAELLSGSLLDQVVDEAEEQPLPSRGRDDWSRFLRDLVAPHLVPGSDPRAAELVAEVDRAVSGTMRVILHHPDFQALESAWRAVFRLVRHIETGPDLKLFLIDVAKHELASDLSGDGLPGTAAYRALVEQTVKTPGAEPWAVIVGNYTFEAGAGSVGLLAKLGRIAAEAGAPFLAAADASFLECKSLAETPDPAAWPAPSDTDLDRAWHSLRKRPEARYLGLALPRYLERLPYGEATDSCESFDFEELSATPQHEEYLWTNPALACALLLGEEFGRSGSEMRARGGEISGLPLHTYRSAGEWLATPCAEVLLTETAVEAILDRGLMALVSLKGRDVVRLPRFQSIADPPGGLKGPWG